MKVSRHAAGIAGVSILDLNEAFGDNKDIEVRELARRGNSLALRVLGVMHKYDTHTRLFTIMLASKLQQSGEWCCEEHIDELTRELTAAYSTHRAWGNVKPSLELMAVVYGNRSSYKTVSLADVVFAAVEEKLEQNIAYRAYTAAVGAYDALLEDKKPSKLETLEQLKTRYLRQLDMQVRGLIEACYA